MPTPTEASSRSQVNRESAMLAARRSGHGRPDSPGTIAWIDLTAATHEVKDFYAAVTGWTLSRSTWTSTTTSS